jgi:hypothetical protein
MAAKFSETSASLPPQRFFNYLGSFTFQRRKWCQNSPRLESSSPPQGAKPCRGLHQTLVTLFHHVVILAKQLRNSPPAPECCNGTHSPQPVCDSATSLGLQWVFALLLLLKETLHQFLSNPYSKVHGKLAVRVCEVGQLHFRRESGKELGLSYKPCAPSRLFVNVPWLKRARPKLPLRTSCITFLGNTRRVTAVKAEMLKGKTVS